MIETNFEFTVDIINECLEECLEETSEEGE